MYVAKDIKCTLTYCFVMYFTRYSECTLQGTRNVLHKGTYKCASQRTLFWSTLDVHCKHFLQSTFKPLWKWSLMHNIVPRYSDKGKPVPYVWDDNTQTAYDTVHNMLLDGIHLFPPTIAYLSTAAGMHRTTANPLGCPNITTCLQEKNLPSHHTRPTRLLSYSPAPTRHTSSRTTYTAGFTLLGGLKLGLTPTANAPPSTWKPTPFCGVWPRAAFTLSRRLIPFTPRATICL